MTIEQIDRKLEILRRDWKNAKTVSDQKLIELMARPLKLLRERKLNQINYNPGLEQKLKDKPSRQTSITCRQKK